MRIHRSILPLLAGLSAIVVPGAGCLAQVSLIGNSVQEQSAATGAHYDGSIVLRNDGAMTQTVRLYLTDYRFTADGVSEFGEAGSSPRSNARWITFGAQTVVVAPNQTSTVAYRVKVPELPPQSASGSFWSVAMIETLPVTGSTRAQGPGVQIQTVMRQAVQLVTHVGTTGAASVDFSRVQIVQRQEGLLLQFDAENNGVRARKLSLSVDLYREDGSLVGRYSRQRGLVYPGSSIREMFSVGSLTKGSYHAFIVADAGDDDLFAGTFKLKF